MQFYLIYAIACVSWVWKSCPLYIIRSN